MTLRAERKRNRSGTLSVRHSNPDQLHDQGVVRGRSGPVGLHILKKPGGHGNVASLLPTLPDLVAESLHLQGDALWIPCLRHPVRVEDEAVPGGLGRLLRPALVLRPVQDTQHQGVGFEEIDAAVPVEHEGRGMAGIGPLHPVCGRIDPYTDCRGEDPLPGQGHGEVVVDRGQDLVGGQVLVLAV